MCVSTFLLIRGTMFIPRVHICVSLNNFMLLWGHGNKHPEDGLMPPSFLAGVTDVSTLVHQYWKFPSLHARLALTRLWYSSSLCSDSWPGIGVYRTLVPGSLVAWLSFHSWGAWPSPCSGPVNFTATSGKAGGNGESLRVTWVSQMKRWHLWL